MVLSPLGLAVMAGGVHLVFALYAAFGARFSATNVFHLSDLWQLAPTHRLKDELLHTVWRLSSQPPLYNLMVGAFLKLGVATPENVIYGVYVGLGTLTAAMLGYLAGTIVRWLPAAVVVSVVVALNPGLILFEPYPTYDLLTTFEVVSTLFCLAVFVRTGRTAALLTWLAALAVLMLTRGNYHAILMLPAGAIIWAVTSPSTWRRIRWGVLVVALLPFGWYTKNLAQYGFFGSSGWVGFYVAKVAFYKRPPADLRRLAAEAHAAPVVALYGSHYPLMLHPELYHALGYTRWGTSDEPNPDDPNLMDVAKDFQKAAMYAVRTEPGRYLRAALDSYWKYSAPPGDSDWVHDNGEKIAAWRWFYSRAIEGTAIASLLRSAFGHGYVPSFMSLLMPLWLLAYAVEVARALRRLRTGELRALLRREIIFVWAWITILVSAATASLLEAGENNRYALYCETLTMVVIAGWTVRWAGRLRERRILGRPAAGAALESPGDGPSGDLLPAQGTPGAS